MLTDYVVIDLEMTGLNAKTDRILEAGAARVRGNVVTATFCGNHHSKAGVIGKKVISLTGITNEMAVQGKRDGCDAYGIFRFYRRGYSGGTECDF